MTVAPSDADLLELARQARKNASMDQRSEAEKIRDAAAWVCNPDGVPAVAAPEVTDAMVDAYLQANDAYWKRTDELPTPPNKWRTGTPREATRESLRAALGVPACLKCGGKVADCPYLPQHCPAGVEGRKP